MPIFGGNSSARSFFERIKADPDPYAHIVALIGTAEEEWLDFKGEPRGDGDVKKIWSKALAGFANITDGLLIWGIDARKDEATGRDIADKLAPISDPVALVSRLRELQPVATNPPVVGVEIEAYPGTDGSGFVVCLIRESRHKPHRAEHAEKQWYYRAGTSFMPAEPGLLRTLFYPQRTAVFGVEVALHCAFQPIEPYLPKLLCSACLKVEGTATARDVYVTLRCNLPSLNLFGTSYELDWDFKGHTRQGYAFAARRPLHPGEDCPIFGPAEFKTVSTVKPTSEFDRLVELAPGPFRFAVHSSDQERQLLEVDFSGTSLTYNMTIAGTSNTTRHGRRIT